MRVPALAVALLAASLVTGCARPCSSNAAQARFEWPGLLPIETAASVFLDHGWGNVSILEDRTGVLAHRPANDTVTLRASILHKETGADGSTVVYVFADGTRAATGDEASAILEPYTTPLTIAIQAKLGDPDVAEFSGGSC